MANGAQAMAGLVGIAITYKLIDETLKTTRKGKHQHGLGLMSYRR
jgi:hypothetical protein